MHHLISRTFSLLGCDMRQSEHGQETLLIFQFWCLVHLLRGEACVELWQRRSALGLRNRGRRATLPEHPPPLPPLLLHQIISPAHGGQTNYSKEVQFLGKEARERNVVWRCQGKPRGVCVCVYVRRTSVESSNLRGGCSATLLR